MALRIFAWILQGYVAINALLRAYVLITMPGPMAARVAYLPGPVRYVAAALYVILGICLVVPDLLKRRGAVEAALALAVVAGLEVVGALVAGQMMGAGVRGVIVLMLIVFIFLRRRTAAAAV